jgi:hypothetical protein
LFFPWSLTIFFHHGCLHCLYGIACWEVFGTSRQNDLLKKFFLLLQSNLLLSWENFFCCNCLYLFLFSFFLSIEFLTVLCYLHQAFYNKHLIYLNHLRQDGMKFNYFNMAFSMNICYLSYKQTNIWLRPEFYSMDNFNLEINFRILSWKARIT